MTSIPVPLTFWSRAAESPADPAMGQPGTLSPGGLEPGGRFYRAGLEVAEAGTLVVTLRSPRPLRVWLDGQLLLDEPLYAGGYQRALRGALVAPVAPGSRELRCEVGPRPHHSDHVERNCPSRNRAATLAALAERFPDRLDLTASLHIRAHMPPCGVRFLETQFREDGVTWQHVLIRLGTHPPAAEPTTHTPTAALQPLSPLQLRSSLLATPARDLSGPAEWQRGLRRFAVAVAVAEAEPPPLRGPGPEARPEPELEVQASLELQLACRGGQIALPLPAFELRGRLAPRREYRPDRWPDPARPSAGVPEPVLPSSMAHLSAPYEAAWRMLRDLVRQPDPASGIVADYIQTGSGFPHSQFLWDQALTAICVAYGHRSWSPYPSLDVIYAGQQDGGYIPRELDVRTGLPILFEPDFSPNPPIASLVEWSIAEITGNQRRLLQVYPLLCAYHRWLVANRRLPDGTYWTTGLANGLDNSPSLGDGYPDLTAQMAHDAEILARIARLLGRAAEAGAWEAERQATIAALNAHLWDERQQIYSTSLLAEGGHNPHKIITAFWPLWAGAVPPERVTALARHLKDPASFWRHHPIPTLAADSPLFQPHGDYWRGSMWDPTNYMVMKGFARAGRLDLAREVAQRSLAVIGEVLAKTGKLWENYSSETSDPGRPTQPDYCWAAVSPIAALIEVVLGLQLDALTMTITWEPPQADEPIGLRQIALGPATISLVRRPSGRVEVISDTPFTLVLRQQGVSQPYACGPGRMFVG